MTIKNRLRLRPMAGAAATCIVALGSTPLIARGQHLSAANDSRDSVMIGAAATISADDPASAHAESFVAVNPHNPQNLIATAIVAKDGHLHCVAYASFDGGLSWTRGRGPERDIPFRANWSDIDPVVYFDAFGTAFFARVAENPAPFSLDSVIFLSRSRDGGRSWEPATAVPMIGDREYFAFDQSDGAFHGRMYAIGATSATWLDGTRRSAIAVGYSTDSGRTFIGWHTLLPDEKWDAEVVEPVVTGDGVLVLPYLALDRTERSNSDTSSAQRSTVRRAHFMTVVSQDGGRSFSHPRPGPAADQTTARYQFLASLPAPRAAVDLSSGPYHGRIYLVWTSLIEGRYAVQVAHSDDTARTWSQPVVVNDNGPKGGEPATPTIAVNKYGIAAVIWNDRRDDPTGRCYHLYFAASRDGGDTFQPNVRAAGTPTCPADAGNQGIGTLTFHFALSEQSWATNLILLNVRSRWPNGGDTQGLVADSMGAFHAAWIGTHAGTMQLMAQRFVVTDHALSTSAALINRSNLSKAVTVEVTAAGIDASSGTAFARLRLLNTGRAPVAGPFSLVLDHIDSQLYGAQAVNADNGLPTKGAEWQFTAEDGHAMLPGEASNERILRWSFSSMPRDIWSYLQVMRFTILGPKPRH